MPTFENQKSVQIMLFSKLDGISTARSRKWCLRHRAILQTKREEIFQIQVHL